MLLFTKHRLNKFRKEDYMVKNININNTSNFQDVLSVKEWLDYINIGGNQECDNIIKFIFTWMKYNNWF